MTKMLLIVNLLFCLSVLGQDSIVLEDNFDDNTLNWYETKNENLEIKIRDGHYYLKNRSGNSTWINTEINNLDPNKEDFTVEVKLEQLSGSMGMGFGILVASFKEKKSYKKFLINGDGQYKIDNYYANKSHTLVDYKTHKAIEKRFKYNVLKVVKQANIVSYYVNDVMVARSGQNNYYGTQLAFFLGGKMSMEIDYIKITKRPSTLDLVDNADKIGDRIKLGSQINTRFNELSPIISADGQTMYVCRSNHPENIKGNDIWIAQLDANKEWTPLKNVGAPLNNEGHNFVVSASPDNNSLILANHYKADGSAGGNGLSISYKTADGWSIPEPLNIDGYYNRDRFVAYFMCADNRTLLMAVKRDDSYGSKDLYVSFRGDHGRWSEPLNMGSTINTFENEVNPFVAADGKTLYFASQGHLGYGHHDIFVAKRLDDTWTNWTKPQNLGAKINTAYSDFSFYLDAEGENAYLGSVGDIWRIENPEKPEPIIFIKGRVFNAKTKKPMAVSIEYEDLVAQKMLGAANSDPVTGAYQIVLPAGKKYGYQATKEGFYAISNFIDLVAIDDYGDKTVDLYLTPIEKGEVVRLNNIFFEFDKAILKPESYTELDRLYALLIKEKTLSIEIAGHTDDKGSSAYNLELSQKRADAVVKYLLDKGIDASKLKGVGYGEGKPIVKNSSDKNRGINRRVEFKVL